MCSRQAVDGIVLVESGAERNGLPQAFDVRLAEDLGRPAGRRIGDAGPVDRALDHLPARDLVHLFHPGASDPLSVEIGHQFRLRVARRRDQRIALPGVRGGLRHSGE